MTNPHLQNLLALGEGYTTEFKRGGTSSLGREICAFANASGGSILIGVTDSGQVVGVKDHNKLKSVIQSIARSAEPPIAVDIESAGKVLCVTVPEQHSKPYSFAGKFFIREGASSQQMGRDEIREFFFREGLIRFDETLCNNFDFAADLTPEVWAKFAKRSRIPEDMETTTALQNLHLLKDEHITYTGAWLLATDIQKFSISATVTCALFRGTTKTYILDRKEFTSDLYSIYEDSIAYLQSKLNTALIPNLKGRDEQLELPEEALREAVVNAIVHRDYRSSANVQIYIFQDRIEIVTPGGLPAGMREEDLGIKSVPRNPLLFGMFHRMNLVEQIGSGIRRMRKMCRDYGVAEPEIEVSDSWLTMTFRRSGVLQGENNIEVIPSNAGDVEAQVEAQVEKDILRARQKTPVKTPVETPVETPKKTPELILRVLLEHPDWTLAQVATTIGKSLSAVERAVARLVREGTLRHVGSRKSGYWEIIK